VVDAVRDLPADIQRGLGDFVAAAREAFGDGLVSVVLYGSAAADGQLRPTSDINVLVVVSAFDRAQADRVRDAFHLAHAAIRLSAMFVLREEVAGAAKAFAQKFRDMQRRHRVLYGEDPLAGLTIPRAALIARLDQVLLNLTVRLRALYVERSVYPEQLAALVAQVASPLRTSAAALAELEGRPAGSPKEALVEFARSLGEPGWDEVLARLSVVRESRTLTPDVAGDTVVRLIELARRMRQRALALA
jgi:hypothetical protein